MRHGLTIVYTTARKEPKFDWFLDSLINQLYPGEETRVICVDHYLPSKQTKLILKGGVTCLTVHPKPSIWKGEHRLTKEDWWSKSNDLNTGIALCETEWIAFCDDRSLLGRHWLQSIRHAMDDTYAVCGSYEKRANMQVVNGVITEEGTLLGDDTRSSGLYDFDSWYGGSGALPLDWCLAVNGFSEDLCDSLGSEDSMFGVTLRNNGFPVKYDSRMRIIEDRTPGEIGGALKRADKGISPNDKSHAIVELFRHATVSHNSYYLRYMRDTILNGGDFPAPSASDRDWFDGQPVSEMT